MTTLAELRDDVVQVLHDGGLDHVYGHLPERVTPPVVLLEPSDPYVTDEPEQVPAGCFQVAYDLLVTGPTARAEKQTRDLDELIQQVLAALDAPGSQWGVSTVAQPFVLTVGSASYLATRITVTTITRL